MRIAVTGSIATDHLMTFPGRIADQLLADRLDHVSLSFLVDTLDIRDGGVAANIAYGLARLGHRPLLVGAAGADFAPYGQRLSALGVDISAVHISRTRHTARFLCTTDPDGNQIASFYPGAMTEAAGIDVAAAVRRGGGADLVVIGADDPEAMLRHTRGCRTEGMRFAADPAQQLARLDNAQIRELVEGADHLFTNQYERALLLTKTGWTTEEVLGRVRVWVTTFGAKGSRVERADEPALSITAVPTIEAADPTGVGDAFRAGYLAALATGDDAARCAQTGSALAAHALTCVGTQTYTTNPAHLSALTNAAYGSANLSGGETS
ncbi:carbohydrate kinase family protein [Streptomyces beihaiensis]|uniref:Carbohydrate kinase family protein n=1 Tax=Streptomyces beihaiensis TaxID=2984495 RepID=A0ABT3U2S5_9ACTN|nr:carbohydrate kinase family protein [Streptomyces beihaiensis]MCX3062907.1 carbohydrate kinase family protein [Streptomyces beihaiensis]